MKILIKYIVIIIILFASACEKDRKISTIINESINNLSSKTIVYYLETELQEDYVFLSPNEGKVIYQIKEDTKKLGPIAGSILNNVLYIDYLNLSIYNLTDTSSFISEFPITNELLNSQRITQIDGNSHHAIVNRNIMITDSLLTICEKDYSMLERFKDYYSR